MTDASLGQIEQKSMFTDFIQSERSHYAGEDNNLFAFALGQAARYHGFLTIIASRFEAASKSFIECHSAFRAALPEGVAEMADEQIALLRRSWALQSELHLEVESFYLFAKILLDKLAQFLGHYFGPAHGCSLSSHNKLAKNLPVYVERKALTIDPSFPKAAAGLKSQIAHFRDKQIAHHQNPRTVVGTTWSAQGEARLIATQLYPHPTDPPQVESTSLPVLLKFIEEYTKGVFAVVSANRARSKFRLDEAPHDSPAA